jgi:hypothetical protein
MGAAMERWRTYTPDGRVLEVEYAGGEWIARCGGKRAAARTALAAVTDAVDSGGAAIGGADPALAAWLAAHAAQLEAEAS